jgi:hypothetical protein
MVIKQASEFRRRAGDVAFILLLALAIVLAIVWFDGAWPLR